MEDIIRLNDQIDQKTKTARTKRVESFIEIKDQLNNARLAYQQIYSNPFKNYLELTELQRPSSRNVNNPNYRSSYSHMLQNDVDTFYQSSMEIMNNQPLRTNPYESGFKHRERDYNEALDLMTGMQNIRMRERGLIHGYTQPELSNALRKHSAANNLGVTISKKINKLKAVESIVEDHNLSGQEVADLVNR